MSTIYALASGGCPSGIAVVRVSGPACREVLMGITGSVPEPRRAVLRALRDTSGQEIDRGLVLWFPGPGSFTGEDLVEFQVHGSRAVVRALSARLGSIAGVRPAEAGEFTRRAFLSGRLDLTEAEGLADLLAAETEAQRRQALAQSEGNLRRLYEGWREELIVVRALIEAELDFADEEDIPGSVREQAFDGLVDLRDRLSRHLEDGHRGERLRDGLQVVILGPPNAGKSTLLNALARRDVAIVTDEAGTTRDLLEVHLDLAGHPVTLVDTAGLRETTGKAEQEGIRRAVARVEDADLVLWLQAPDLASSRPPSGIEPAIWLVKGKSDLDESADPRDEDGWDGYAAVFSLSATTGQGLDQLTTALSTAAHERFGAGGAAVPTRERHRVLLETCREGLEQAIRTRNDLEIAAEWLRRASDDLGRLTGRIDVEDLLDHIFGSFCIGK